MAETGWTKEWPTAKDSFHWMRWVDGRYRDLPVHVNGIQVMSLFDHSYQQRGDIEGQVEFLGPISPSDFEQLTRLQDWKESAMTLLARYDSIAETFGGKLGSSKIDNLERGVERLREAAIEAEKFLAWWVESTNPSPPRGVRGATSALRKLREALARQSGGKS